MMATIVWYCIIFTTDIGFSGEWRNNTMKNIVSFGTSRNTIFFGKCIVNTLLLLIGIVVVSAAYLLTNYICFRHDGSLTASAYQNYFLRFVIMLPMIIAGQTMASSLCMFFSTDLLWCGIYAVVVALLPNGIMLFYAIFPEVEALRIIYTNLPTVCLTAVAWQTLTTSLIVHAMEIAAVLLILPTVISLLVFQRKEIK